MQFKDSSSKTLYESYRPYFLQTGTVLRTTSHRTG